MFRLIKLAIYALVGYALYEIYQGMTMPRSAHSMAGGGGGSAAGNRNLRRALNTTAGRMQTLTGAGMGQTEQTLEPNGGSAPHRVGRGVTVR